MKRRAAKGAWRVVFTGSAACDAKQLAASGLKPKAERLLALLARDPFEMPPSFERQVGRLAGASSRRINIQHRLVYDADPAGRTVRVVRVLRMWTHYE